MKIISFNISGAFAAFRDPSVTTNQMAYYIPSKSAVVGLLGAMMGVRRDNALGELYSKEYLDFFATTKVGIRVDSENLNKVVFYTNHRSLKEIKTKPVKKELVENPSYTVYAMLDQTDDLMARLKKREFVFTPYLGHAYCPATITDPQLHDGAKSTNSKHKTRGVILDESEPFSTDFEFACEEADEGTIMIERHLHHFFKNGSLQKKVMRHWIPMGGMVKTNDFKSTRAISEFYKLGEEAICLY